MYFVSALLLVEMFFMLLYATVIIFFWAIFYHVFGEISYSGFLVSTAVKGLLYIGTFFELASSFKSKDSFSSTCHKYFLLGYLWSHFLRVFICFCLFDFFTVVICPKVKCLRGRSLKLIPTCRPTVPLLTIGIPPPRLIPPTSLKKKTASLLSFFLLLPGVSLFRPFEMSI